jgi:hypothetical protein
VFATKTRLQKDLENLNQALLIANREGESLITIEIDGNRVVSPITYRMISAFDIKPVFMTHRQSKLIYSQIALRPHEIENILMILRDEVQDEINRAYAKITNERRFT